MPRHPIVVRGRVRLKKIASNDDGGVKKERAKKAAKKCAKRIAELQELFYAQSNRALLLLFQGLDASGKDGTIRKVLHYVNPAGVETTNFKVPSAEEKAHDFLWRVHRAVPRYGNIGIFNRSHYEAVLAERVIEKLQHNACDQRCRQIVDFERMLTENGVVLLKFFLYLSKKEQAKRFRERLEIPHKKWKFSSA